MENDDFVATAPKDVCFVAITNDFKNRDILCSLSDSSD